MLEHALVRDAAPALQLAALEALLAAAAAAPYSFASRYAARLPWLRVFLAHTDAGGAPALMHGPWRVLERSNTVHRSMGSASWQMVGWSHASSQCTLHREELKGEPEE